MKILSTIIISVISLLNINFVNAHENTNNKRVIYLFGENHFNEDDKNFRAMVNPLTARGIIIEALEYCLRESSIEKEFAHYSSKSHKTSIENIEIYGVEDPVYSIFKAAMYLNNYFKSYDKKTTPFLAEEIEVYYDKYKQDMLNFLMHKENQHFLNEFWNDELLSENPIFEYLKENKKILLKEKFLTRSDIINRQIQIHHWDNDIWANFANRVVKVLTPIIMENIPKNKIKVLNRLLKCFEDFKDEDTCGPNSPNFINPIGQGLRDPFIINNLEEIYLMTESKKKPLVCILGRKHLPGVQSGLEKKGFKVITNKEVFKKHMLKLIEKIDL